MGLFDKFNRKNRQPGQGNPGNQGNTPAVPSQKMHPKVREAMGLLEGQPDIPDDELADLLELTPDAAGPFIWKARRELKKASILREQPEDLRPEVADVPDEKSEGKRGSGVTTIQSGNVSLVTFSSEELLLQVQEQRNRVSFDLTATARFMDTFNQNWSWAGPILFALGTIGEIFLVLWQRQTEQTWFTGATIIAVSLIAEGTLLAISFSSKRLRNRAEKRSTGWTDKEKHKLEILKRFWFLLAIGVAATQVAFVVAQTNPDGIGLGAVWLIAIVRALSALVADAYTAFVSEEKPTTGDLAIEQQDRETQYTKKVLEQKVVEVDTLNAGSLRVQEVGIKAEMDQDRINTQKEIAMMQNKAQIDTMRADQEQKVMIDRMRNSAMRAVFDPDMDPQERQQILTLLTGLAGATKELPGPTIIEESI